MTINRLPRSLLYISTCEINKLSCPSPHTTELLSCPLLEQTQPELGGGGIAPRNRFVSEASVLTRKIICSDGPCMRQAKPALGVNLRATAQRVGYK